MTRRDVRAVLDRAVDERTFQEAVIEAASLYGWRVYHTYDSRRSTAGFPDLVLVKPPLLVVVELKTERGQATRAQLEWLHDLEECDTIVVDLWRPSDFDDAIEILAGKSSKLSQAASSVDDDNGTSGGTNG